MTQTQVPEGYIKNSKGGLDPIHLVKEIDLARDELVREIATSIVEANAAMSLMKNRMMDDIKAFIELSAEKYGVSIGGKKGNIQLLSYDGEYKILIAVAETISFDERLQVAKALIDDCIKDWASGSRDEIKALVNDAFYVGKAGKINTQRILGLRRLDIKDERWGKAMDAISESIQTSDSKEYLRAYIRNTKGEYDLINLDFASL